MNHIPLPSVVYIDPSSLFHIGCPRKFLMTIAGYTLESKNNVHLVFGSAVHSYIARTSRGEHPADVVDDVMKVYKRFYDEFGDQNDSGGRKTPAHLFAATDAWDDYKRHCMWFEPLRRKGIPLVEQKIEAPPIYIEGQKVIFCGTIDSLGFIDGNPGTVDFKTSQTYESERRAELASYALSTQMLTYEIFLETLAERDPEFAIFKKPVYKIIGIFISGVEGVKKYSIKVDIQHSETFQYRPEIIKNWSNTIKSKLAAIFRDNNNHNLTPDYTQCGNGYGCPHRYNLCIQETPLAFKGVLDAMDIKPYEPLKFN